MRIEVDKVDEVVNRGVRDDGRIIGLTKYKNRKVKVLILDSNNGSNKKGRTTK